MSVRRATIGGLPCVHKNRMMKRGAPPEGLAAFCEEEYERLVRLLSLYCGNGAIAEELAHETLIKACRQWSKVKEMEYRRAWLHRVGMNLANSYFRRRSAEKRAHERLEGSAKTDIQDHSEASAIRSIVAGLPPRQRTVILLHYFDDLTYAQIAELLGCPESTTKSLARRAMKSLREQEQLNHLQEAGNVV